MYNQEKNLIIRSSICDNMKNLRATLLLFKKSITKNDLNKIVNIDLDVYKLINTRDAVIEMKDSASSEWTQKEFIGKRHTPCELCGSKKSEDKYIIINRLNKSTLSVGSSCIFKFKKMNSLLHGVSITEIARLSKQNPEKYKRIVAFNEIYPGGKSMFSVHISPTLF